LYQNTHSTIFIFVEVFISLVSTADPAAVIFDRFIGLPS